MVTKSIVLVFLVACHTSPPSVSRGSGSGETRAPTAEEPAGSPPAPQIAAPAPTQVAPATTSAPESRPTTAEPPPAAPTKLSTQPLPAKQPPPPTRQLPPPTDEPTDATKPGSAAPGITETCGANDACATGLTCVSYYGFAGARGPQFKTCEVRCQNDKVCPKDTTCVTVADGPGRVCR
jgi:hypothetical protein